MTRWIITVIAVGAISVLYAAPGCGSTGVGDPCTPDAEYDPTFQGFSVEDVSVESKSYVCLSRLCLVNHFQGRVTCPYGQKAPGVGNIQPTPNTPEAAAVSSGDGCSIPGTTPGTPAALVSASNVSVAGFAKGVVPAQVVGAGTADRTANKAVYCSCRCANVMGETNDGDVYCTCPSNYTCTQLVTSIGGTNEGLTGAYCVQDDTKYSPTTANTNNTCDPTATSGSPTYCPLQF